MIRSEVVTRAVRVTAIVATGIVAGDQSVVNAQCDKEPVYGMCEGHEVCICSVTFSGSRCVTIGGCYYGGSSCDMGSCS